MLQFFESNGGQIGLMYTKAMLWEYEFYGIFEKHSLINMALRAYQLGTLTA